MLNKKAILFNRMAYYTWLFIFVALLIVFYISFKQHGLEIQFDSTTYIRGALNLKDGLGFTHAKKPINHFPIGLSYVYYILMLIFPGSIYTVALYFNLFLLACVGILFKLTMQEMKIEEPIQLASFIIFFLSPPILFMGSIMLTELPTAFLILLSTYLLVRTKKEDTGWVNSLLIGIILGTGILIRFAMIGVVAGFACYFLWMYRRSLQKAILHITLVVVPGVLFSFFYSVYYKWRYHYPSVDREFIWHPISIKHLHQFFKTPFSWIVQFRYNPPMQIIVLGVLTVILLLLLVKTTKKPSTNISHFFNRIINNNKLMLLIIIPTFYCLFIIVSISLFDASTPIDTRILSIISMYLYLGIALVFNFFYQHSQHKEQTIMLSIILALVLVWPAKKTLLIRYLYPQSFSKPFWQNDAYPIVNDKTSQWINPNCIIYTNGFAFWQLCNNDSIVKIPDMKNVEKDKINTHYLKQMIAIRNEIANNKAQLFYFNLMANHPHKTQRPFIDSFFADTSLFKHKPFKKGVLIEAKRNAKDSTVL